MEAGRIKVRRRHAAEDDRVHLREMSRDRREPGQNRRTRRYRASEELPQHRGVLMATEAPSCESTPAGRLKPQPRSK